MKALIATVLTGCTLALAACATAGGPSPAPAAASAPAAKPAPAAASAAPAASAAVVAHGAETFKSRCAGCHEPAVGDAPERADIAKKKPEDIRAILKTGVMQPMAAGLSDDDITALIAFLKS